jgi:acyl-CoA synthetase (AMP-forming)/AMP-acid ligase II
VTTISCWLRDLVETRGDAAALVEPGGRTVSFSDLEANVARLAGGLQKVGLGRGDRLAFFVPNGILTVELILAAGRLGAVSIGVNTRYRAEDLRGRVEQARPRFLVTTDDFLGIDFPGIVASALDGLAGPPAVLVPEDIGPMRTAVPVSDDLAETDDLLIAFSTSGTTGVPKLAAHDHATTVRHLDASARSLQAEPGSTTLLALPLCGTFGFVSLFAVISAGGRGIIPSRFEATAAADLMERYGVTHFNGSDDMLIAVCAAGRDLSAWQQGVQAEFTGRGLEAVRGAEAFGARITGVYGSSETFALLARRSPSDSIAARARSGGTPVDAATEVRILDDELQLRGPSVLNAYLVKDGTAAPPLVDGGWLPTGDLGSAEPDGAFVYLARKGDALRLRGFLTDPAEIEQHLLGHACVSGAQVVGTPGEQGGEVAVAFVTLSDRVTEAGLVEHCRRGLANYKVPVRVVVLASFPTVDGANGVKIRKGELRRQAAALGPPDGPGTSTG